MVRVQYSRNGQIKTFLTYEKIKRLLWNITVYSGLQITNALGQKHMRKMKNDKKNSSRHRIREYNCCAYTINVCMWGSVMCKVRNNLLEKQSLDLSRYSNGHLKAVTGID